MRKSQWFLLATFFIAMGSWFVFIDSTWGASCNYMDTSSALNKADLVACVNAEILDPFIWLLFPLGFVFLSCGYIELFAEKKKRTR